MPGLTWGQSERRALTSRLMQTAEIAESKSEAGMAELAASLRSKAAARTADTAWSVEVKTVGSSKDPLRFDVILSRGDLEMFRAWQRARTEIKATDGIDAINPDSVAAAVMRDPLFKESLSSIFVEWFTHGVVNGEAEMERIYRLGGTDALHDVVTEVRKFNEVTGPLV